MRYGVSLVALLVLGIGMATAQTPDFVEDGVGPEIYVERYLNEAEFITWYDTYYPDIPFHEALQISQAQYDEMVMQIASEQCEANEHMVDGQCIPVPADCGPGTVMSDNRCVVDPAMGPMLNTNEAVFQAQGEGLQLGVAAAAGFGIAIGILLFLWLPSRIRKRMSK